MVLYTVPTVLFSERGYLTSVLCLFASSERAQQKHGWVPLSITGIVINELTPFDNFIKGEIIREGCEVILQEENDCQGHDTSLID